MQSWFLAVSCSFAFWINCNNNYFVFGNDNSVESHVQVWTFFHQSETSVCIWYAYLRSYCFCSLLAIPKKHKKMHFLTISSHKLKAFHKTEEFLDAIMILGCGWLFCFWVNWNKSKQSFCVTFFIKRKNLYMVSIYVQEIAFFVPFLQYAKKMCIILHSFLTS